MMAGLDPVCRPGIMYLAADDPDAARRGVRQVMDRWSLQGFYFQSARRLGSGLLSSFSRQSRRST